jgi:hypothetical protein
LGWAQLRHRSEEREQGQLGFEQESRRLGAFNLASAFNLAGSPLEQIRTVKDQKQEAKQNQLRPIRSTGGRSRQAAEKKETNRRPTHFCCSGRDSQVRKLQKRKTAAARKSRWPSFRKLRMQQNQDRAWWKARCLFAGSQDLRSAHGGQKLRVPLAAVSINRDKHAKICRKENSSRETTDQVLHELEVMPVKVITEQDYKLKQQK